MDDILNLPVPDPRVGETFRLGGDLDDLIASAAAARLRSAFTCGMLKVDVFTAAAALAESREAAAALAGGEQVPIEAFKAEAMALLGHATRVRPSRAGGARMGWADAAGFSWRGAALAERSGSIAALEEVLLLTRAVELQMLTGRLGE
ncbi:hypothetical protein GPECTOR_1g325 [Gonium pectorale]|uniref:Uncharacterized protein n=1 Tax=Gonium pectorale TaxID=33097 RepID=A0A150H2G4_GONPE|nr:hypothetical protein GPECTOR_1g325 [Gonium pectorale]|eukprot:KXZ56367.1 hypothetical protein GPECTOR_1g325 [Gonium pectorale]